MMGGKDVIMRSLLSERRSQESAADQAGIKFLEATRQSGRGMLETFENFAQQEYVSAANQDPFVRSHPVAADRIARLRDLVAASPYVDRKDSPALQLRHDMARAKISGYLERPQTVYNRYPASDNSLPARYARAIARNCSGHCDQAMGEVDALIKQQPDNPFFWEIKGSFYYWSGKHREAITPLAQGPATLRRQRIADTVRAGPGDVGHGGCLTARRGNDTVAPRDPDRPHPRRARIISWRRPSIVRDSIRRPTLPRRRATSQEGNVKQAQNFAKRAMVKLPRGSPEWIRAEDITKYKVPPT